MGFCFFCGGGLLRDTAWEQEPGVGLLHIIKVCETR